MGKSHLQDMSHVLCIPLACVGIQVVAYTLYMYVTPPYISSIMGLCMLLLLYALIPCLAAYILPSALVSLLFSTVIPTSFNILVEMFLFSCI